MIAENVAPRNTTIAPVEEALRRAAPAYAQARRRAQVIPWVAARPGEVVELRVLRVRPPYGSTGSTVNLLYAHDRLDDLADTALLWSGKAAGVYATLNPTSHGALRDARAVANEHVVRRQRLVIDVDPERADKGGMANDEEHEAAPWRAATIAACLRDLEADFPEPVFVDPGNGGQLVYAVDLSASDGGLVRRALRGIVAPENWTTG